MLRAFIWLAVWTVALLRASPVLSQTLEAQRLEYDSTGKVTYLELAYRDSATLTYFSAYSDGGRLLKYTQELRGDTVIEFFRCHDIEPHVLPSFGDELIVGESGDSMTIGVMDSQLETRWDTTLSIAAGNTLVDLYHRSLKEYASLILDGRLPYAPQQAKLRESWVSKASAL